MYKPRLGVEEDRSQADDYKVIRPTALWTDDLKEITGFEL